VKLYSFVPLRLVSSILGLAGTELAKVLCGFGYYICKEFHLDAAEWFAYLGLISSVATPGVIPNMPAEQTAALQRS
jgi:hypothetical protein